MEIDTTPGQMDASSNWTVLDEQTCWDRLESGLVGRLAVCVGHHPDVFPVNYVVADRTIIFRTEAGTKLAAAILGSGVSFEIDRVDALYRVGWSVVVHGRARELERLADILAAEESGLEPWVGTGSRWVEIRVDSISGREIGESRPTEIQAGLAGTDPAQPVRGKEDDQDRSPETAPSVSDPTDRWWYPLA